MDEALELLDLAVSGVGMFPPTGLLDHELRHGVIGVQRHIDRLKVLHANLVHEADRRRLWAGDGARDMADWLADRTKTSKGDAHSRVKLGAALGASDVLKQAAENGDVSAATAESLFDAVTSTPEGADDADVADLVDACKGADPRDAADAADQWKQSFTGDTPEQAEARRYAKRSLRTRNLGDGMGQLIAIVPLHDLRQITSSISHVAGKPSKDDSRTTEQRLADGLVQLCIAYAKGEVAGGREKPSILITIDADHYTGATSGDGHTSYGDRIPSHVVRFLAEQAMVQRVVVAGNLILNVGRAERYATDTQWKALMVRDGGCRVAGCHIPAAWCDVDHVIPWEHGGTTDLHNLVLLCRHHHTVKHSPGVNVHGGVDNLRLELPNGTTLHCPPKGRAARDARTKPRTSAAA